MSESTALAPLPCVMREIDPIEACLIAGRALRSFNRTREWARVWLDDLDAQSLAEYALGLCGELSGMLARFVLAEPQAVGLLVDPEVGLDLPTPDPDLGDIDVAGTARVILALRDDIESCRWVLRARLGHSELRVGWAVSGLDVYGRVLGDLIRDSARYLPPVIRDGWWAPPRELTPEEMDAIRTCGVPTPTG